ncbi:hypothetical protein [Methanobrevibacter arboriphilus]|uniref:Uncharacterized protein n=1 Tax=Methanobrevibacter arboriphilus TaxID=39441 RepID=A0ACA8R5T3_METAZ|nr:hypothetical protein [Methanobrevibacter arboriphilus]BBL62444.1 hypothetical protein MarbSA_14840 [Methanobrevibacter arboriphilus]
MTDRLKQIRKRLSELAFLRFLDDNEEYYFEQLRLEKEYMEIKNKEG